MKTNKNAVGALAATLLASTAFLGAPAASATDSVQARNTTIVATDAAGTVIAQDQTSLVQATPSAPRAVTVTTEPGSLVTIDAKGVKPKRAVANRDGQVTFTKLTAGKHYTVTADGQKVQVTPVIKVGKAAELTVTTTDRVDTVDLTWKHKSTRAKGDVGFTITATPLGSQNNNDDVTIEATGLQAELPGLDPLVMYEFSVTPHNALGSGKASTATMNRTLAAITGIPVPDGAPADQSTDAANAEAAEKVDVPPVQPVTPAPQPAPAPAPKPAPTPSTRTIWVCPSGYNDVNGVCTQTQDYTFHDVTETKPYSYHTEFVTTGWRVDPYPCTSGTMHPDGCWVALGHDEQVKDATPSGWTDNGSSWERTVEEKDATPAGWSDNGSAWIRTTAKVEKVVPA